MEQHSAETDWFHLDKIKNFNKICLRVLSIPSDKVTHVR
jgi:hypothetical protein